jgi:methylmalonyl-CoA mutase N-terminal domain/subunit
LQLSKSGWNFFRELEREGGIISCISNSFIADRIAEEARAFLDATENGSEIIIGVNKYQLPETLEAELAGHLVSKADIKIPELYAGIKKAAIK